MDAAAGTSGSWKKRIKGCIASQVRQVPCLHAAVQPLSKLACWNKRRYQTLGQSEEDDGGEIFDDRQSVNEMFGNIILKIGGFFLLAVTVLYLVLTPKYQPVYQEDDEAYEEFMTTFGKSKYTEEHDRQMFQHDAPMLLYLGVIEILVCGACAQTAAAMYKRRRHALKHPSELPEKERRLYVKVEIEKDVGLEDSQLYGLGFRPSTDGLECLVIETVRRGSLVEEWNKKVLEPSVQELVEEAFGLDALEDGRPQQEQSADPASATPPVPSLSNALQRLAQQVRPFSAIVAVNDVAADVGMMQLQLMKPKVTLWLRSDMYHVSQLDELEFLSEPPAGGADSSEMPGATTANAGSTPATGLGRPMGLEAGSAPGQQAADVGPTFMGRPQSEDDSGDSPSPDSTRPTPSIKPRCACVGLEDEEPQILTRWTVCGILFTWVTLLPVLLMRPNDERPRQQLFRRFLLRPCMYAFPVSIAFWVLDCAEILFTVKIVHPFWYFTICHMLIPGIIVWRLFRLQAADEQLVLEQRRSRESEAGCALPMVVEDPVPTFLKELITVNPVALMWLGCTASLPILVSSLFNPLTTQRGKMAQGYVHVTYGPLVLLQAGFLYLLWNMRFLDLPKLYMAGFTLVISLQGLILWCICVACSSRYSRQDFLLVYMQRRDRARAALGQQQSTVGEPGQGGADATPSANMGPQDELVDCTEAYFREFELIYSA
eukprot:TRINITY_DN104150_c0_g1_i1.p1 TRINITY_DN104150_c0_g1~~TRINITY_DN104150_c0_g1_i1.p1  ORF type:complete len:714 (+),score=163.09 TRINITY_DN104150_c0_g1_i1:130-2271(+)